MVWEGRTARSQLRYATSTRRFASDQLAAIVTLVTLQSFVDHLCSHCRVVMANWVGVIAMAGNPAGDAVS